MTEALLFEIQFALNRPQHIIGDPSLVAQLNHRHPFGGDERAVQPLLGGCRILVECPAVKLVLDEPFKASSAILDVMLSIINERVFDNGGTRIDTPTISLYGASNELL